MTAGGLVEPNQLELHAALTSDARVQWDLSSGASGIMDDYGDMIDLMDFLGEQGWRLTDASARLAGPLHQLGLATYVHQLRLAFSFKKDSSRWQYRQLRMQIYGNDHRLRWYFNDTSSGGSDGESSASRRDDFSFGDRLARDWREDGWELAHTLAETEESRQLFFMRIPKNSLKYRKWQPKEDTDQTISLKCTIPSCRAFGRTIRKRVPHWEPYSMKEAIHRRLCSSCLLPMELKGADKWWGD